MKQLIMLKGLPASGKSQWAKERLKTHQNTHRVNKDDLRAMLDDGHWSKGNEDLVLQIRDQIIIKALGCGHHVIVDDTNLAPKHEARLRELAKQNVAHFEIVDFTHVDVETCIERDRKRQNYVGEKVIRNMYNQFLAPLTVPAPRYDSNLPNCIICDIDGTVAKMTDRSPYDYTKVLTDAPNKPVVDLIRDIASDPRNQYGPIMIYVSGRKSICREDTIHWMMLHGIPSGHVFMREDNDNRDDRIVKLEIYMREIEGRYNVTFVLDDRSRVVNMWRSLGLTCFQVAPGDF